jgi:hypothetical protein
MNFKEEQERSVLSIFHQVRERSEKRIPNVSGYRFLFHLSYDVEKGM